MKGIKELHLDGERVFIKKSKIFGWRVVFPIKIDGKTNWKNLLIGGSWINFAIMVFILLILLGVANEYITAVRIANECLSKTNFLIIP